MWLLGKLGTDATVLLRVTDHHFRMSKLRKPVELALGPEYSGARVSRKNLMNDDDDEDESAEESDENSENFVDPDTVDLDAEEVDGEIDSDEALGESDNEKFDKFVFRGSGKPKVSKNTAQTKRAVAADFMSDSDENEAEVAEEEFDEDHDMMNAEDVAEEVELDMDGEEPSSDSDGGVGVEVEVEEETGSEEEESENEDQSDVEAMDVDQEEESDEDDDEDSEDSEESDAEDGDEESARRAELRKMMSEEQRTVVATISQAAKADTEKGIAVKAQRKTFDSLLNVRIRLQRALVATNSLAAVEETEDEPTPYKAAEEAAVKLLNTLNAMRHELDKGNTTSKKRKLATFTTDSPSADIWANLQTSETQGLPKRQATLEKWSAKVRGTTATPVSRKLNQTAEQSITDVLSEQLSGTNGERLVKRTHLPRSCAPVQVKAKLVEDANIFDDADFYQLLLKELVDQRMIDAGSVSAGALGQSVAQWAAVKEAKTKKNVDTKASKGRKMKFTVHEKLQNFMAPEDRTSWEPEALDRFFGTLLGQRMDLGEDVESEEEDEALGEDEALKLFRS